jgi:hypothetical protein
MMGGFTGFRKNKISGEIEAYKDGKKIGVVKPMEDVIRKTEPTTKNK